MMKKGVSSLEYTCNGFLTTLATNLFYKALLHTFQQTFAAFSR